MSKGMSDAATGKRVKVVAEKISRVHSEILVLGIFQDVRPMVGPAGDIDWMHNGILSRLILRNKMRGAVGEATLLAGQRKLNAPKIMIVGLGNKDRFTPEVVREVYSYVYRTLALMHIKDCAVELFTQSNSIQESARAVEAMVQGFQDDGERRIEALLLIPDEERARRIERHLDSLTGNA